MKWKIYKMVPASIIGRPWIAERGAFFIVVDSFDLARDYVVAELAIVAAEKPKVWL